MIGLIFFMIVLGICTFILNKAKSNIDNYGDEINKDDKN